MREWNESEPGVARTLNKKKKTAQWCKGKKGVEHRTVVVRNHNYSSIECGWYPSWLRRQQGSPGVYTYRYSCKHSMQCVNCGKYVVYFLPSPEDCPDYEPRVEDEATE